MHVCGAAKLSTTNIKSLLDDGIPLFGFRTDADADAVLYFSSLLGPFSSSSLLKARIPKVLLGFEVYSCLLFEGG